MLKIAN